ncbi:MAG: hypothetical protein LF885_05950 [Rickettsia endosymbiont of Culicoides impunctatus]|uniref:colicin E3/pyocin S6 family cytotoxin n=1 Tax=unclassified Candidatus Tisiphia TaxID=2996318 RepID=UPI001E7E8C85|nr:MAG: hypothetical protein LF885_05950 [Rickettsia endosymbiont of Culicoides impunctatus]
MVEQKYAIISGGDKIEQAKGVAAKEQQVAKTRDHTELPAHPEHSEEPGQTKDELDVKLQKIIQEFVKDKPEYAEKINKIGYKELKEQLVEYTTSSHDQLQEQDWWGNITSGIKELFGVNEAEAALPLIIPVAEIIKYGGAALILSLTASKLASESDGNNWQSDFEKRKHDDRGKSSDTTSQQQKTATSSSFMPNLDPDDFEPDDEEDKTSRKQNCEKSESPIWKELKPYKGKTKTNGLSGNKQRFYEWDHTHNDIEIYDSNGCHQGSINPKTGELYKEAVKGRKLGIW